MNTYFVYLALLLLMFLLIYYGVDCSFRFAPPKIKMLSLTAMFLISLRYIALIIFLIMGNIKNLYLLKPFIFLNLLCMPVLGVTAIYICARNDKIKFNYIIGIVSLLVLSYAAAISKLPINVEMGELGYIMTFNNSFLVDGVYLILNTIFFFIAVVFLGNRACNKIGILLVLGSAFVVMAETVLKSAGVAVFPVAIIGDVFWLIAADYSIYKFKK